MIKHMLKAVTIAAAVAAGSSAAAAVVSYTDLATYNAAVGAHTILTFTGLSTGTVLSNQFAATGATFTDGDDTVTAIASFVVDGVGYVDNGSSTIVFASNINHFGVEFPGAVTIQLFDGALLVGSASFGGAGTGFFGGLVDTGTGFNRVVLTDNVFSPGFYDNLHFGTTGVPEPATVLLTGLAVALLASTRRRS